MNNNVTSVTEYYFAICRKPSESSYNIVKYRLDSLEEIFYFAMKNLTHYLINRLSKRISQGGLGTDGKVSEGWIFYAESTTCSSTAHH